MLVLLMTVATGAWAQEPATYKITLAEGTEDADKWTISPNPAPAGAPVTATYSGDKKVKSVKAVKKAAPKPDLLAGEFSVSASKKVKFSKGNLSYASSKWSFFDNQYDYYNSYSADAWDHFGWSTSATDYGMNTSTSNDTYSGDFVDWGATMGDGWRTLTNDEWTYLFDTRTSGSIVFGTENGRYAQATINTDGTGVNGMILFPDGVTIASTEVTTAGTVNAASTYATKCTSAQWTALETKGCVFLPAAGQRDGSSVNDAGSNGRYWSGTAYSTSSAYRAYAFNPGNLYPADGSYRYRGYSVRLVQEVAAPATDLATITANYEAKDGDILTGTLGSNVKISIADGAKVTLKDVTINGVNNWSCEWAGITCEGDATITLEGTNTVKGFRGQYPGIYVPEDKTLTIEGEGSLNASGNGRSTGIGGGFYRHCGNIVINGGNITATGGNYNAGIGGGEGEEGDSYRCGSITINGGTVTATGGDGAAGIGCGYYGASNDITITSGTVMATGGENAAGIGSGEGGSCGAITISGGTVTATAVKWAAGIGGGNMNGASGTITITSGVTQVTATKGSDWLDSIGKGDGGEIITVIIEDYDKVIQN